MDSNNIPEVFLSPYDSSQHEKDIYTLWEKSGYFNPDKCLADKIAQADKPAFSMVLPPPNVTGVLHLGHATTITTEDILIRYHRMRGNPTVWVPGTDSAAIATQSKVEKIIAKKEKTTRHKLGREAFLQKVEAFAENSKETIIKQTKAMGASLDWSRYAFTLDEKRYRAVMTAFINMYNEGLIYRADRIVNWDPKGQTTISDDEIVYQKRTAKLYTFKYHKDFPISIATTRPETKVGDVAVAVHPDDKRYQKYIGQTFDFEFCDVPLKIKIVADKEVNPEFGTGAVGVTPAHSKTDWDIADRAHLTHRPQVINEYAKMSVSGRLSGLKVETAREEVISWLKSESLLEKEENTEQNVATAERTGAIIEPLPKLQWWIAVNKEFTIKHSNITGIPAGSKTTLKEIMTKTVKNNDIKITPERFERVYFNWINNLNDWCISRQIWYGHRIPAWYKDGETKVQIDSPGEGWEQETDTLDTWFSSGLWTFSTLGWPESTVDLKNYHPTSLLETGYDIIFFWVARMILMSGYHLGEIPFKKVYLHGLVRDENNKKMSKSLGNIIDPLDMIEKFGTDALRLSLIIGAPAGNDIPISENKIRAYKKFSNKLWNISRFILTSTADADWSKTPKLSVKNKEVLSALNQVIKNTTEHLEKLTLHLAAEQLYHYVWHELADKVLEDSKKVLSSDNFDDKYAQQYVLKECLINILKLLHPFTPFITETIWQKLPESVKDSDLLLIAKWPKEIDGF